LLQDLAEAIFVNERNETSAPDATLFAVGPVPQKKLWTIQAATYYPSAAETRICQWFLINPGGTAQYAVSHPLSIGLSGSIRLPLITEGLSFQLLPGQYISVRRDVATVGSTMAIGLVYIETDMPIYHYTEPLMRERQRKSASVALEQLSGVRSTTRSFSALVGPPRGARPPQKK